MLEEFDDFVEAPMAEWQLPGLALAVTKERETILMEGYGVRDVDSRLPVTSGIWSRVAIFVTPIGTRASSI
ncbi:serine hydrolase [Cupriavidus malaysiensis]|uniref:Uncharacterized protein n=1 Tax=Cupriavidus malaysiensis TaxID=367825 RepID=A0ABN4TKV9_9BURK|nr:serine hydrolase [Cupriavidus malaysiensis]AOZ06185.1 hypothetical protein BKK80_10315 [Cupriavidus malaysiensis]